MDLTRLQEMILLLEEDKKELDKQKDAIDTVIVGLRSRHGLPMVSASPDSTKSNPSLNRNTIDDTESNIASGDKDSDFPHKASFKEQIVYLFKHHLKEANRYPEIQEAYNKALGVKRYIRDEIMALRREENPIIRAIKFNRNSNSTYTGLTEWITEVDGQPRFQRRFFDLKGDKFPKGIMQSEWANLKENQEGHTEVQP